MNDEKSNALPAAWYGDPVNHVRFESETCAGCKYQRFTLVSSVVWCGKGKHWGRRCALYLKDSVILKGGDNAGS